MPELFNDGDADNDLRKLFGTDFLSIIDTLNRSTLQSDFNITGTKADLVLSSTSKFVNCSLGMKKSFWEIIFQTLQFSFHLLIEPLGKPSLYHTILLQPIVLAVWNWLTKQKIQLYELFFESKFVLI